MLNCSFCICPYISHYVIIFLLFYTIRKKVIEVGGKYTEAQKQAAKKYMSEKTDDIRLRVPKGTKEEWKNEAEKRNKSMTQFVVDAVNKEIKGCD